MVRTTRSVRFDDFVPLRDRVRDEIRQRIIDGDYAPGCRIVERDLADQLGVSRVPIREALAHSLNNATIALADMVGYQRVAMLARRAGLGLARTGSTAHHGSGEVFLALATGLRGSREGSAGPADHPVAISGSALDPFFAAVVEGTEEAVLNSLLAAPTVTGRDGHQSRGLPADQVRALMAATGRLSAVPES